MKNPKMAKKASRMQSYPKDTDSPDEHEQDVLVPLLDMTGPYYPRSLLAQSMFSGYYTLFVMYSIIFMVVFPLLNYLEGKDLFGMAMTSVVKTNLVLDLISTIIFVLIALLFSEITTRLPKRKMPVMYLLAVVSFIGGSLLIAHKFHMYFTDRIFVVVLSWSLCVKVISYMRDIRTAENNPSADWALK